MERQEGDHHPAAMTVCMCVCVCVCVCLFDTARQSVLTTIVSGLHGPQGPVSTLTGDWGLIFIRTDQEKITGGI